MSRCQRSWEVEAARDGRLAADAHAQFVRHLSSCAACTDEQTALQELANQLHARPHAEPDQLTIRRRRQQLLALANEQRLAAAPQQGAARARLPLVRTLGLLLAAVAFASYSWYSPPRGRTVLAIQADHGASYRSTLVHGVEVVSLEQGRLSINVQRTTDSNGVVIHTPDGEIRDIGTTFTVLVEAGRTTLVEVSEGQVWVSLRTLPRRLVAAGQRYEPYGADSAVGRPRKGALVAPEPNAQAPERASAEPAAPSRERSTNLLALAREREFRDALQWLARGDAARAARALARFERRHPTDPLAEDAAYLRVVALLRAGQHERARSAGNLYLSRYRHGFRRADILQLMQPE